MAVQCNCGQILHTIEAEYEHRDHTDPHPQFKQDKVKAGQLQVLKELLEEVEKHGYIDEPREWGRGYMECADNIVDLIQTKIQSLEEK